MRGYATNGEIQGRFVVNGMYCDNQLPDFENAL